MKNLTCCLLISAFMCSVVVPVMAQTEVPILRLVTAYVVDFKAPFTELHIDNDSDSYFSTLQITDSTLVFLSNAERREYNFFVQNYEKESLRKLNSKKKTEKKESIVNIKQDKYTRNIDLLKPGLEIEISFYEYRYSKKFIMQTATILTDLKNNEKISGKLDRLDGEIAIVGGQTVRLKSGITLLGDKGYRGQKFNSFENIPKGTEMKLIGKRQIDGSLLIESGKVWADEFTDVDKELIKTLQLTKKVTASEVSFGEVAFPILQDNSINAYINRIGHTLVPDYIKTLPLGHPNYINFKFFVVINSTFNACAYPDGSVFINTGLLNEIDNEAQLAAVLGHEISHVTYHHGREEYIQKEVIEFSKTASISTYGIEKKEFATMVAAFGGVALSSSYSRKLENQADIVGLSYMLEAGYDPREATKLWSRLQNKTPEVPTKSILDTLNRFSFESIYASHPSANKRYKTLKIINIKNYQSIDLDSLTKGEAEYLIVKNRLRNVVHDLITVEEKYPRSFKKKSPTARKMLPSMDSKESAKELIDKASSYEKYGQYEKSSVLYKESLTILEKTLGKHHPDYLNKIYNLTDLYTKTENYKQSFELIKEAVTIYRLRLLDDLGVGEEDPSQQSRQTFDRADFGYSMALLTKEPQLGEVGFNQSLMEKGAKLLAYQQLQKLIKTNKDSTVRLLYNRQYNLRQQLRQLYNANTGLDETGPLEQQVQDTQKALLLLIPDYHKAYTALQVEWQQVQQKLKPGEAAIEFVHFRYWHKRWTDSTYYAALIVRPGWLTPRFVYLCEQRQLNSLLSTGGGERQADYVARLYGESNRGAKVDGSQGKPVHTLRELVWQPMDALLTGVHKIFYAPSGLLHRLNLGAIALNTKDRLTNRFTFTLLSSTRQVALPPDTITYSNQALLLGNIRYNLDSTAYQIANANFRRITPSGNARVLQVPNGHGTIWPALDQTALEIDTAAVMLKKAGFRIDTLQGGRASEEGFYYFTQSGKTTPRYIHFATHGYFEEDHPASTTDNKTTARASSVGDTQTSSLKANNVSVVGVNNPLIQSGLVLAGANNTQTSGQQIIGREDGILTAYEISLLDLQQTELVVLSACETGLGKIQGSEGVYGLQRALKMAGVKNIIMSLWKVDDVATSHLMQAFYRHLLTDKDKPGIRQSFDKAVIDTQNQYHSPYFWAGFVLVE